MTSSSSISPNLHHPKSFPRSVHYSQHKIPRFHPKNLQNLTALFEKSHHLRKVLHTNPSLSFSPKSSIDIEIDSDGTFSFNQLREFLKIHKKYLINLKIRLSGDTFLDDQNIKRFLSGFKRAFNLNSLDLELSSFESAISNKGLNQVLHQLRAYPFLKTFNILCNGSNNCVKDESMVQFASLISKRKKLEKLEVNLRGADNFITDQGLLLFNEHLLAPIPCLKALRLDFRSFGVKNNKINDNGAYYLSLALLKLPSIEDLYIDFSGGTNGIGDDGLSKIAVSLQSLKNLQNLTLDCQMGFNEITSRGARVLSESLNELQKLQKIYLDFSNFQTIYGGDNRIGDIGLNTLIISVYDKLYLENFVLKVERNNISDYGIKELAKNCNSSLHSYRFECDIRGNECVTDSSLELLNTTLQQLTPNYVIYT